MLRATAPSAWTATVESGADVSKGTRAARSSSSGSACALSSLRTRPPKENRDERRTVRGYLHRPKLNSGERSSICTASAAGRSEREHRHLRELEAGAGGRATRAESPRRGAPW